VDAQAKNSEHSLETGGHRVTDLDQKTSKMTGAWYGSRDDNLEVINYDADSKQ
jgi:hypothetical protein